MPVNHEAALDAVLSAVGWRDPPRPALSVSDTGNPLTTSIPITAAATAALSAVALAALAVWQRSSDSRARARLDTHGAALAMGSAEMMRVGDGGVTWAEITGFYPCGDGRWLYLHGNFPHLRDGLLELFAVPDDRAAVARRMKDFSAQQVEDMAAARGLCAAMTRTRDEWQSHPQGQAVRTLPLIELRRIGDAPRRVLHPGPAPLAGLRMLDLSRIIAGPMCGRTIAEHGADVLLVSGPHLPSLEPLVIDTGFGKRSAFLDLRTDDDHAALCELVRGADIFLNAYRPGSLARRGFSPEALAALRPGIVSVTISAWSRAGPWSDRRGYDSLVQGPVGLPFADTSDAPKRLPFQPLDYLTGYLAAFGAMEAIRRQNDEGGSWHVELSLARTAWWLWELTDAIGRVSAPPPRTPSRDDVRAHLAECDSAFGRVSYLKPALEITGRPPTWPRPPVPLGTDLPRWLPPIY